MKDNVNTTQLLKLPIVKYKPLKDKKYHYKRHQKMHYRNQKIQSEEQEILKEMLNKESTIMMILSTTTANRTLGSNQISKNYLITQVKMRIRIFYKTIKMRKNNNLDED